MKTRRVLGATLAAVLLVPALAMLFAGAALTIAYGTQRDDNGFFSADLRGLQSSTAAIISDDIDLRGDPGPGDWVLDRGDVEAEVRVTALRDAPIFVGVGPTADVNGFLAGVAHDEVTDLDGRALEFARRTGTPVATPPSDATFWESSATGTGQQVLNWDVSPGSWTLVVMNADGSAGIAGDLTVAAKADFVLPAALVLLGFGAALSIATVAAIVKLVGRSNRSPETAGTTELDTTTAEPVRIAAVRDTDLSPWQWLIKWVLAIPHFIVLAFLWLAFIVLTVAAGISILFTGRYPERIFSFNVGVLRWTWRVSYYATTGGIGTDRYPPFSLEADPGYPATLDIDQPTQLSRGLVLVKWFLAIPHFIILSVVAGWGGGWWLSGGRDAQPFLAGGGLLGILVLFAGVSLLFRNRYPNGLFALIIGLNRWIYRVIAYAALMTDRYPPFRLDQGGSEPSPPSDPGDPAALGTDLRPDHASEPLPQSAK